MSDERAWVRVPALLHSPVSRKAADEGSGIEVPATHVGYLGCVLSSWLWPGIQPRLLKSFADTPVDGRFVSASLPFK